MRALIPAMAILLAGCSFDMNRQRKDVEVVDGLPPPVDVTADGPTDMGGDGTVIGDGPHKDQAPGETSPPDAARDLWFPEGPQWGDLLWFPDGNLLPDLPCNEPESVACPNCPSNCPAAPGNSDGDGLDNTHDPQPSQCNALLFPDDFVASPQSSPFWTVGGAWSWSCGQLNLDPGASLSLSNPGVLAITGDHLVEVQFTIGNAMPPDWVISLMAGAKVVCSLTADPTSGAPKMTISQPPTCNGPPPWQVVPPPLSPGDTVTLQLYRQTSAGVTTYTCRMFPPTGGPLAIGNYPAAPAPCTEEISISTEGRVISLDWFHAFELN
jgi:hypothetical protein